MENTKQQVREFYDQIGWSQVSGGLYQNARYEDLRPVSREYIHKCHLRVNRYLAAQGDLFLDAGSGPVQWPEYLTYSAGYRYRVCADISITALKEARTRLGRARPVCHGRYCQPAIQARCLRRRRLDACHPSSALERTQTRLPGIESGFEARAQAVVVNGWHNPWLMRMAEPFIRLGRFLTGRAAKRKKDWAAEEDQAGTFVGKMTPRWLKSELARRSELRDLSLAQPQPALHALVRPSAIGRQAVPAHRVLAGGTVSAFLWREWTVPADRDQKRDKR